MSNHTVERIWPEINTRVNYPIKACLIDMEQRDAFDLDVATHKFCVSWFSLRVANVGATLCVNSWNAHSIPGTCTCTCAGYNSCASKAPNSIFLHAGKGVPNRLASANSHNQPLSSTVIPSVESATQQFEALGGNLTHFSPFGRDPLADRQELITERERQFHSSYPDFAPIFHKLSNGCRQLFEGGLLLFIQLTEQLALTA